MFNRLIYYYKLLKKIINNRNKLFISNYKTILILFLKIRLKLSIIYYLKTNRWAKRIN